MIRQAILVLGMHRSGTSALSAVVAKLGAQPPKTLMRPNKNNPRGYWESKRFFRFHERLLRSAGGAWADWDGFNAAWLNTADAARFGAEFRVLLKQEFGESPLFSIKDPRMCRLLPFWLEQLRTLNITAKAIIAIRNPLDVACSLQARDGIGIHRALLIWLRHSLDAEFETRHLARSIVRYEDLLSDWRALATKIAGDIAVKWPNWPGSVEREIDSFLSSELRHHAIDDSAFETDARIHDWIRRAFEALRLLAGKGGETNHVALTTLDEIREEFNRMSLVFGPVVREYES